MKFLYSYQHLATLNLFLSSFDLELDSIRVGSLQNIPSEGIPLNTRIFPPYGLSVVA